ncbi:macro domain-containing protein [Candidatus Poriferisodalis sp.]|uniref:macro domain-containing protein n=1 Tax=Candidatus Poriferisodalis sp. TaxID=3101277 RepID=UPI003B01C814
MNTVNCVGVMGKGVALAFREQERFAAMYRDYRRRCTNGEVKPGEPYMFPPQSSGALETVEQRSFFDPGEPMAPEVQPEPWVLNFPTKQHWRGRSKIEYIENGLAHLERHYEEWNITSLALPALGCENGGLRWTVVGPLLRERLSQLRIPVFLYLPRNVPEEQARAEYAADST